VIKKCLSRCSSEKLISVDVNRFLSFGLRVEIWLPYRRMGSASALNIFILEDFWTKVGLNMLFRAGFPSLKTSSVFLTN
jgi:hypothetical protein